MNVFENFDTNLFRNLVEVDFDTDESGLYRAKSTRSETLGATEILDTSITKVNLPIDLLPAEEVKEKLQKKY